MARVFRATDTVLGVDRAVKILESDAPVAARHRLETEARIMAQLNHPNVLRIYDVGFEDEQAWVVMDLARHGSLADLLDHQGALPPERVVELGVQILSALDAAHRAGVVHRDVKPQNVLIGDKGEALLADFGIARLTIDHQTRSTRTNAAMGSLCFMAPEQRLDARTVGPSADLYALGCTLYNLACDRNPVDLFLSPSSSPRWEGLPSSLVSVLRRATDAEPSRRYADARTMAAALLSAGLEFDPGLSRVRPWFELDGLPPVQLPPPPRETFTRAPSGPTPRTPTLPASPQSPTPQVQAPLAPTPAPGPEITLVSPPPRRRAWALLPLLLLGALGSWALWPGEPTPEPLPAVIAPQAPAPDPVLPPAPEQEPVPAAASSTPPAESRPATPSKGSKARNDPSERGRPDHATKAPTTEAAPEDAPGQPSALVGSWNGTFNGRAAVLELSGHDKALHGVVRVMNGPNSVATPVKGSYNPTTQELRLQDQGEGLDIGSYRMTRGSDGTLSGSWETSQPARRQYPVWFSR